MKSSPELLRFAGYKSFSFSLSNFDPEDLYYFMKIVKKLRRSKIDII